MSDSHSVKELRNYAEQHLSENTFSYFANGAGEGITLNENKEAFNRWKILPRYLRNVNCFEIDVSTTILGEKIAIPICASPTGLHKAGHPKGEIHTALGCLAANTCMAVSAFSTCSYEDISVACPDLLKWCQMYIFKDKELTMQFVKKAESCGYKALLITIDTGPLRKRKDFRETLDLPNGATAANFQKVAALKHITSAKEFIHSGSSLIEPCLNWSHVQWLKSITKLPVVLKGILSPEDAVEAVKYGVDGILVSNKGGRKMDVLPSTLEVLPAIAKAVRGKIEIYVDGGVRNGIDVFKALALGANAVFIGRPVIWGLVHNGHKGVEDVFELMKEELQFMMANAGCAKISDINENLLVRNPEYLCKL